MRKLPSLRRGPAPWRNEFWVITALVAGFMLLTVLTDVILHWESLFREPVDLWVTVISATFATAGVVVPCILRQRFPRWFAVGGYFIATGVLVNNLYFAVEPTLVTTALHILPVMAMYLGWCWSAGKAWAMFLISAVAVLLAATFGSKVGFDRLLSTELIVFTVFIMLMCFLVPVYLRKNLSYTSSTDSLTGVLNFRGIHERLENELSRAFRRSEPFTIAVTDFDGFKKLNDTLGHAYGDEALRLSVRKWQESIRLYDVIGRLGGDEFVFIFPRTTSDEAERVLWRLEKESPYRWSWGFSQYRNGDTVDAMIARADARLYEKKRDRLDSADTECDADSVVMPGTQGSSNRQRWRHQSPFSVVSALIGCVAVLYGSLSGVFFDRSVALWSVWVIILVSSSAIIVPLWFGHRYPARSAYWTGGSLLIMLTGFAYSEMYALNGLGILYSFSILALYLGTFAGTRVARYVLLGGLAVVSVRLSMRAWAGGTQFEVGVIITAIVYAVLVCVILFEIGSYMYSRSRILIEHDALTGVLNRYGLTEYGGTEVSRAERGRYPLSAVMLDCIDFKRVNDTQGHQAGDRMLSTLAHHLVSHIASDDIIVRMGGDEFLVLFPYLHEDEARTRVEHMLKDAPIRMHVGVSELQPGETLESLIMRADDDLLTTLKK